MVFSHGDTGSASITRTISFRSPRRYIIRGMTVPECSVHFQTGATMTERDNFLACLAGEVYEYVPVWLMGFENEDIARTALPGVRLPDNLSHNPERTDYPWDRITDAERERTLAYNRAILKPVACVGWGANMPLGHGGPGEFHFRLLELKENERLLMCETGAKRLVRKHPHFYKDFDYPLGTAADVDRLDLPDPHDPARYRGFAEDAAFFKAAGYIAGANLNGFFSGPHYFCLEYQQFLMELLLDPENAKRLIDTVGAWTFTAAEEVLARGAECLVLCDDLGSADNLLISPELYETWILPWHRRLCDLAHEHGAAVHLHSHGNINRILPLVLSAGVDMLDPFDTHEHMDLPAFLEAHPASRTIPVGGLHKFFFTWDRDRQNEWLTTLFARTKGKGRWMLMDPGGVPDGTSPETVDFLINRLAELRRR